MGLLKYGLGYIFKDSIHVDWHTREDLVQQGYLIVINVSNLRRKLSEYGGYIQTISGFGYKQGGD